MAQRSQKRNPWADHYTRKAQKEGLPARSVFKLQEMQHKYRILKPGDKVCDLGCAPGSWAGYAAKIVGPKGSVTGLDQKPVSAKLPQQVRVLQADIFNLGPAVLDALGKGYDIVLSDMAPATTGNKRVDSSRSFNLCQAAFELAQRILKPGGTLVCKIFQGEDFQTFVEDIRKAFEGCRIFKPKSSRKASKEIFIIGTRKI